MTDFRLWVERRTGATLPDYDSLHRWSIADVAQFWELFARYTGVISSTPYEDVLSQPEMPGANWFEGMKLNFAENILERGHSGPAVLWRIEGGAASGELSFGELRRLVARCARGLRQLGIKKGDRVAGLIANVPEAIIAALATASLGATWSSASPDFGLKAVVDRFSQVEPKVVFASTYYRYKGRVFETTETLKRLPDHISSIERIVLVPYPDRAGSENLGTTSSRNGQPLGDGETFEWSEVLGPNDEPEPEYEQVDFGHPLFIMFSSGTTGAPKCMVHGTGGTLLTHRKEHQLHCDLNAGDRLLYFTTCGWMMWNWQLTALSVGAAVVCFDGNPAYPDLSSLWKTVNETQTTHFGTSGKHIESCMKGLDARQLARLDGLPSTRSILYTGSPLSETGYSWIYEGVKSDVHLAGISGGTDILSCFVLGNPNLPVYAGEIQCKGLGVDVQALDEDGEPIVGSPGELVCRQPLPSMPVRFLNDPDGERYRSAYFDHFEGLWRHGDFVTFTKRGGVVMHGRSDATLNPGGVRIGSAELYSALDQVDWVKSAVAVGYKPPDQSDEIIVLLVALGEDEVLTDERIEELKVSIRKECSPRHVPKRIFQVSGIPVTRSGKTTELAVKAILHGQSVKNRDAMANPETLDEVEHIRDLLTSE